MVVLPPPVPPVPLPAVERDRVPASLLSCPPRPAPGDDLATEGDLVEYLLTLDAAAGECRTKLEATAGLLRAWGQVDEGEAAPDQKPEPQPPPPAPVAATPADTSTQSWWRRSRQSRESAVPRRSPERER